MKKLLAAAIAALALSGCSGMIGPGPSPQLYTLSPQFSAIDSVPRASWTVSVAAPATVDSLDSQRIALTRPPTQMDYFANAAWTDRAPVLVQGLLVEAFERSGKIVSVARESEGLSADYVLQTDLRDFEAVYDQGNAPPNVTVRIEAKLIKYPDRTITADTEITRQARASANDMNSIVEAFDQATQAAVSEVARWALAAPVGLANTSLPGPLPPGARVPRYRHHRRHRH